MYGQRQIIVFKMNRLSFDPNKQVVQQWSNIYLRQDQIALFEDLTNKLYVYLDIVLTHKIRYIQKESKKNELISGEKKVVLDGIDLSSKLLNPPLEISLENNLIQYTGCKVQQITQLRQAFVLEYSNILHESQQMRKKDSQAEDFILNLYAKYKTSEKYRTLEYSKIDYDKCFQVFQRNFSTLQAQIFRHYESYMVRSRKIIKMFSEYKAKDLQSKICQFKNLFQDILTKQGKKDVSELDQDSYWNIKTLFENIFIEAHYLSKLMLHSSSIFGKFQDTDNNPAILQPIRINHKEKMKIINQNVEQVRKQVRGIYISLYETTKAQRNDPNRLQRFICKQVAVNHAQFQLQSHRVIFCNGMLFAILLVSLIGILVFREMTLTTLQGSSRYMSDFKIWRGASYLIFMNWVAAIVFSLFDYCKINYRLILTEYDTFVPKPQTFFQTAFILSSVYLTLFLVYLLKAGNIIDGHESLMNLGYFMWLINIIFMLNPFKVLNYQGRKYFIKLILKSLISPFRPMNNNIFFVTLIMCSFVQPFSDLSFTVCSLTGQSQKGCNKKAETATFVYSFILIFIGIAQNIRCHMQLKTNKKFTGPILSLISCILLLNSVIGSLNYSIYLSQGLFVYWIVSAGIATIAAVNADIRAHWALISFTQEDCMLRPFKSVPREAYLISMAIDFILNIGWVFTISNNLSFSQSINPMYFFMILSYIELARKGIWMFFRVECDHSSNIANLNALESDERIYDELLKRHSIIKKGSDSHNSKDIFFGESEGELKKKQDKKERESQQKSSAFEQLKRQIVKSKQYLQQVDKLQRELKSILSLMHENYSKLGFENQI